MTGQQKTGAPKPRQESGKRDQIEGRKLAAVACVSGRCVPVDMAVRMKMNMREVEMEASAQKHQRAQEEPHDETDQIKICPGHSRPPFLPREFVACGCSASSRRSASPGVSKIAPSKIKHLRVSFSRASLIRTLVSSGSPAKRSDACSSHTSRLPSVVRKSDVSSV